MLEALPFREIWAVDFEFGSAPGENPVPVCLVAQELRTGKTIRQWQNEFGAMPPYPTDANSLFVAYFASAEIGCHLALGWPPPVHILDLFTEFRVATNGLPTISGNGLLGALVHHGLDAMDVTEKDTMRNLVLRGGPWTDGERTAILDYCAADVAALAQLLPKMLPAILQRQHGLGHALLRGRYMAAIARMEHTGVPIDTAILSRVQGGWIAIQDELIAAVDQDYGVYDGRTFKAGRFEAWLEHNAIGWPRLSSGALDLSTEAFRERERAHPQLAPLRELRASLSDMRLSDLAVGADGRNRTLLSPFRARTGRNQPSNARFIFGPAVWMRGLIQPPPGHAIAYIDWSQQEFGIAAALSGDPLMKAAYESGDPYMAFAIQAGAAPEGANKATHKSVREQFKACVLAVQYGMEAESLAFRIGQPTIFARDLLRLHRETYRTFWKWSDAVVDTAMLKNRIETVFGWPIHIGAEVNPRSLRNFPMQANGAEMLRLACCLATERDIQVCAPVHDAVLIMAPLERLDADVAGMRAAMAEASRIVLGGFELGTEVTITRYPDRYADPRGVAFWDQVMGLLEKLEGKPQPPDLPTGVQVGAHRRAPGPLL